MLDERLPDSIAGFSVGEDGVLSKDGVSWYPWFTKQGYLGGTVRYRLIAEDVDAMKELFQTQENSE